MGDRSPWLAGGGRGTWLAARDVGGNEYGKHGSQSSRRGAASKGSAGIDFNRRLALMRERQALEEQIQTVAASAEESDAEVSEK